MQRFHHTFCLIASLSPAIGWAQDSGADAFAARDFAGARAIWLAEAAQGSAESMLGLGLLADRGFGQSRDLDRAFDWYQQAADLGLAEAQFNIAIMHDAGIGRARDASAAQLWYTRAALRDHARAQYNLGLLYETGDGVAANPAVAAHWFDLASPNLPAAAEKSQDLPVGTNAIAAPQILFSEESVAGVEVVWDAAPETSATFLVEALHAPSSNADYDAPFFAQTTAGSGYLVGGVNNALLRVSNLADNDLDYASSQWIAPEGVTPPIGRVTLIVEPEAIGMRDAADIFADQLRSAGYWVRVNDEAPAATRDYYISYGFSSDQLFASEIADYLPAHGEIMPMKQVAAAAYPGEIFVNLSALQ